ncbi:MAG: hypothetical protein WCV85_02245 [Patescibacteria group bacterium]|jgi:hypothetical protein
MIQTLFQKFVQAIFRPKVRKFEHTIGYALAFRKIPGRFIQGMVEWDITNTFKKFGINVEEGVDYWTMGHIVHGSSTRFDRHAPEYQAWLGGYIVKLPSQKTWTVQDHFQLAIADQNSWLHTFGDPQPMTSIEGWEFTTSGSLTAGQYVGQLYEGGCTTHSDVGNGTPSLKLRLESDVMADLFNLSNPDLHITGKMLLPGIAPNPYETLRLRGYVAIFHVDDNVKVVLYGNGAIVQTPERTVDTFEVLKHDLLAAMQSCEITKIA